MKIKLLNLLNKILKKFAFLGLFSFSTSTSAQTTYQCLPCPEGSTSPAGSTSIQKCVPVDSSKTFTTSNGTMTLAPGWYRVTLRSADGSATTCGTTKSVYPSGSCKCFNKTYTTRYDQVISATATAGSGASASYLIYVNANSTATYTYNSGAPILIIKNNLDNTQRAYSAAKGGNGTCSSSTVTTNKESFYCPASSAKNLCGQSGIINVPLYKTTYTGTKGTTGSVGVNGPTSATRYDKRELSTESISVGAKITRFN